MYFNPLPCTDANGCAYLGGFFHHLVAKMTSIKNGRAKMHVKLLCRMDQWLTELKGCIKHVEPQHKEHMECDGMNKDVVNRDGKHWWYLMMQSMSKSKKEKKMVMPKASAPQKLMTAYVRCMMFRDVLNLFLLCINDHNWNKEHMDVAYGMDGPLM